MLLRVYQRRFAPVLSELNRNHCPNKIGTTVRKKSEQVSVFIVIRNHWKVEPFIELNPTNKGHFRYAPPFKVNDYGIPLCPKGFPMVFWGYQKNRSRLKWRCPKIAGSKLVKSQVCCDEPCSPSAYGRTVYTKPHDDLRFFTTTPRKSDAWMSVYKLRSGSERSFSRKKKDYDLERCRVRSLKAWYWRTHFAAINQHLDAWVEQYKNLKFDIWAEVLGISLIAA